MNKINTLKGLCASILGTLTSLFGMLAVPVLLLVVCNIIDYLTGIGASRFRGQEISSYKGMRGITKKVGMWLLIVVGAIVDELLAYSVMQFGVAIPFSLMIAAIVAVWLICNELISILENLKDIGVPLPAFVMKLTKNIKSQIETQTSAMINEEVD